MPSTDEGREASISRHNLASNLAYQGTGSTAAQSRRERFVDLFTTEVLADDPEWNETTVEKRRRLAALGSSSAFFEDSDSNSDDNVEMPRRLRAHRVPLTVAATPASPRAHRVSWGDEVRHD
jgi:Alkali metal cation/H+ antiporter Nha1 C terminus